ncbi:MAG: hypothetical protein GC191_18245 [Azospirillum sp.]|nr:hypothetical protein [Azospirillum sp.]
MQMSEPRPPAETPVATVARSVSVNGRSVRLRLESITWDMIDDICRRENGTPATLLELIDQRRIDVGLAAAVRLFVTRYFRAASAAPAPPSYGLAEGPPGKPSVLVMNALDVIGPAAP